MEGKFLSGRFAHEQNATVLRGAILDHRDQLHVSPNPKREDDRQLEATDAGEISVCAQSAAKDHAFCEAARLRRLARILLQSYLGARRKTRAGFVSASAQFQKRRRRVELISARTAVNARGV